MDRIRLDGTTYKQTVICRQLFTDLHAGFSANGKKEKMHQMIDSLPGLKVDILLLEHMCDQM